MKMSKDFFDGRFNIKKINYEKILKDFNIYKLDMDLKKFYDKDQQQTNIPNFLKKIKSLENIKAFYINKGLYLLGDKNFKVKSSVFTENFKKGDIEEINNLETLEKIDSIIILNLLLKYIPSKIFEENTGEIKYIDTGSLYLFLKKEKNEILRFFRCSFEKSRISEDYLLNLTQTTFVPEKLFTEFEKIKLKKYIKLGFDKVTRVLIPNEQGNYYKKLPSKISKEIKSNFLVENLNKIKELRSYYFTLVKEIIGEYLSSYITLEFKTLKNYELYSIKSNKSYFSSKLKKLSKEINVYRVEDIDKKNNELIAKDDFKRLEDYVKRIGFNNITFKDKGIATIDTDYENPNSWNIFLLNDPKGEGLLYDGYKEIKRKDKVLSNGLYLENRTLEKTTGEDKAVIIRVLEELFIKDAIRKRDISCLHSKYDIFEGVTCFLYKNKKIGKIIILEKGKIKIEVSEYPDINELNREFNILAEKFELINKIEDKKQASTLEIKFISINNKDIYIVETGMRIYFDSNKFIKEYKETNKNLEGNKTKSVARGLNSFLGMSMLIRLNKKENLYYSFYDTGINSKEKFSPNIRKLICYEKLTNKEYSLFCESLVFKYLSNGSKLSTFPFFFKLLDEVLLTPIKE